MAWGFTPPLLLMNALHTRVLSYEEEYTVTASSELSSKTLSATLLPSEPLMCRP
jgi:hypothetical protein